MLLFHLRPDHLTCSNEFEMGAVTNQAHRIRRSRDKALVGPTGGLSRSHLIQAGEGFVQPQRGDSLRSRKGHQPDMDSHKGETPASAIPTLTTFPFRDGSFMISKL